MPNVVWTPYDRYGFLKREFKRENIKNMEALKAIEEKILENYL
jgi:hypothetical protein